MMLLGLVLHSAMTYMDFPADAWSLKDPRTTHVFNDFIVFFIHSFRMPVFFVVAGFFGAMLFYERQPGEMVKNRVLRIVYPFIVFLFILYPITIFSFGYTSAVFSGQENPILSAAAGLTHVAAFLPEKTFHLWFLYYLILITAATVATALFLKNANKLTQRINEIFGWIITRPGARVLFFSGFLYLVLSFLGTAMVDASVSFVPDMNTFLYFWFFYLSGWVLYKSKHHLGTFTRHDWACVILAITLAIVQGLVILNLELKPGSNSTILILLSSVVISLLLFGITGLFVRYYSEHSARMRYISDSSYWVYLIHLPLTALIPAFIWKLPLPAVGKFILVLSGTAIICFVSYHYLVRNTFVGKFLNGRKYPRRIGTPTS